MKFKSGTISKVLGINKDSQFDLICEGFILSSNWVVNHSKNIIDLIEVGDIIEVKDFDGKYGVKQFGTELSIAKDDYIYNLNSLHCKLTIKNILTKEQYEANSYKLGDDK